MIYMGYIIWGISKKDKIMHPSIAEIEKKSVPELRKEISRLKIKIIRDGYEMRTAYTKKDELVEAISKYYSEQQDDIKSASSTKIVDNVVEAVENLNNTVERYLSKPDSESITIIESKAEPIKTAPTTIQTEFEYTDYEQLLKKLSSKYYQGFRVGDMEIVGVRQFAEEQIRRAQTNQSLMDVRLFATVAHFKEEITSIAAEGSEDGKANASTVINLRGEIINRIKKAINSEREQFIVKKELEGMEPITIDYLTQAFEAFRTGVIASFSQIAREKRESQGTNFLARRTSTPHASVANLVQWAISRLKSLPTKSQEWREVALAIMIVTGRRPAEVMSTGVFKAIDQTNLEFYGQLKKKGESDEKIYKIPALGNTAREVEIAIQWLEMMNKRTVPVSRSLEDKQDSAKKCHDRFSRYLSEIASQIMPTHLVLADGASWDLAENRSRIKPYLSRQIYLQIISKMVQKAVTNGVSIDPDLAVTYYSGHYLSVDGKDANAENYLADIVINDMENVRKIWDWKPDLTVDEIQSIKQWRK